MKISINQAAEYILKGQPVAVPTETVYGLAASLNHSESIDKVFELKGRPSNNPLIIHVAQPEQIRRFAPSLHEDFWKIALAFWPGPMTLVLPILAESIPERVRAGLTTAAFRIPRHPMAQKLIKLTGPLVMPSANLSGRPSATSLAHVEADFGIDFPGLDGGASERGLESTILYQLEGKWVIIRQGAIASQEFVSVLGYEPLIEKHDSAKSPLCPGQLYRHYAPQASLELFKPIFCNELISNKVVVGYSDRAYRAAQKIYYLGPSHDPQTIASSLYATLRSLDQDGVRQAYLDFDLPDTGLYRTIKERIIKASLK